ncbi:uncharacterized protein LOC143445133 [Clavelina lepadiformis]|uniref:uncharacterized protein LOC143445133 n=1 Tax=Clavelina lepadiformis TaxID=159417 RepID=UPI00404390E7
MQPFHGIFLLVLLGPWLFCACNGALLQNFSPQNPTRVAGADVIFSVTAANVNDSTVVFRWFVNNEMVANVTFNSTFYPMVAASTGYELMTGMVFAQTLNMTLKFSASQSTIVNVTGGEDSAFTSLTVKDSYGPVLQNVSPQDPTRVAGADVVFSVTAANVSDPTVVFRWFVRNEMIANVTFNSTFYPMTAASTGYELKTGMVSAQTLNMALNFSASQSGFVNITVGDASTFTFLTVEADCGSPPNDLNGSCLTFLCIASGTVQKTDANFVYQCINRSVCGKDARWTPTDQTCEPPMGCAETGKWGNDCANRCGAGCVLPDSCDFTTGSCLDRHGNISTTCAMGYTGERCDQNATSLCANGTWGQFCDKTCGAGCVRTTCDRYSGQCTDINGQAATVCTPGYTGPTCSEKGCQVPGTWGETCLNSCGNGCPGKYVSLCDMTTGACLNSDGSTRPPGSNCSQGYTGKNCDLPNCPQGCGDGVCVAPNLCQNCPLHFASGPSCRNIRLDGFLKGSLPTFAILTAAVLFLTIFSKWYIRRKLKIS